jgi:hypothetical protein
MSETVRYQLGDVIIRERVENMLSIPPCYYDPLRSKKLQSLRNGRQVVLKSLRQFRNAHLSMGQQRQKAQPSLVSKSPKDRGRATTSICIWERKSLFRPHVILPVTLCV